MPQPEETLAEVYVQPGESHLVSRPSVLRTVLGSCVGITFLIPRLGLGALCHPMLPSLPAHSSAGQDAAYLCRYVDFAIQDLARRFDALGARRLEVEVKLFGGADVLTVSTSATRPTVGRLNGETALRVLREERFDVAASSLGGGAGIHIEFYTESGEVRLRRLG